jgi:DNA segregation ATPase FtsK/SpoIIIE-like protein
MRALIAGLIRCGYPVRIVDPKKLEFRLLDGLPGVTRSGDGRGGRSQASIVAMIEDTHALMEDRNDMSAAELARQPRVFLVVDELVELVLGLNRYWRATKMPGETGTEHPAVGLLVELATLARSARIHLIFGLQRPDVSVMGKQGGLIRDQLGHRISVGPLKSKGAQMMWEDDYELATKIRAVRADGRPLKGRALATGPTGPREVQVYWVDLDDEAVLAALSPFTHLPAPPAPVAAPAALEPAPELVQAETAVAVLDETNVLAGNLSEGDVLLVWIDGERQARFVEEVVEVGDDVEVRWSTEDGEAGVDTFDALETVVALG